MVARPEGVPLGEVDAEVERLQAAGRAGEAQRLSEADVARMP